MTRSQSLRSIFILLAVSLFIAACGGGGGGSSDLTPDNFSFTAEETAEPEEVLESGTITVGGIDKAVSISIADGEYRINGGTYTSSTGTVSQGQTVEVRLTASPEYDTEVTSTVTIGGVSGSYSATTRLKDIEPSTLSFDTIDEQEDGATVTSLFYVVAGVDDDTEISINLETSDAGATYSINSEEESDFVTTAGQVSVLDEVRVRVTAGSGFSATTSAFVTVGSVEASFSAVTIARDVEPGGFSIDSKLDQPTGSPVTSNPYTVVGINAPAAISIVSPSSGVSYSINSEDADDFVSIPGTVVEDDVVRVRIDAGDAFDTDLSAIVAIGGVESTFSISTEEQDIAPDVFSIVAVLDAGAGAVITSDDFPVAGINDATAITISAGATYSLDSIVDGDFTSTAGTVTNEQRIRVRLNASAIPLAVTEVTLTLGTGDDSQSATFTVRTALAFESPDDQLPSAANVVSATTVAIADFSRTQNVVVTNGEYSVDDGTTYQASGEIENGQNLQVRANASATTSTDVVATVTITDPDDATDIVGRYTVTTIDDNDDPIASVVFPTLVSVTDGTTLIVRGVASDVLTSVTAVDVIVSTVGGGDVTFEASPIVGEDLSTWTAQVTLTSDMVNTVTVSVTDLAGNTDVSADSVTVTQQTTPASFPNSDDLFFDVSAGGISLDAANNRLVVADADAIFAVNLDTGVRTELIDSATLPSAPTKVHVDATTGQIYISSVDGRELISANSDGTGVAAFSGELYGVSRPYGLEVSAIDGLLYVVDNNSSAYTADTGSGDITSVAVFDENYTLDEPRGLAVVSANTILFADQSDGRLLSVDISVTNGVFTQLLGPSDLSSPQDVEYDSDQSRAIFVDSGLDAVLSVPVAGGSMTTISDATTPNANNMLNNPSGIAIDGENNIGYVPSYEYTDAFLEVDDVIVVDLVTGERVVLSRSVDEPD